MNNSVGHGEDSSFFARIIGGGIADDENHQENHDDDESIHHYMRDWRPDRIDWLAAFTLFRRWRICRSNESFANPFADCMSLNAAIRR